MLGRYISAALLCLLAVLAGAVLAAPTSITSLGLTHDGNFTVLTVTGNGPVRVAHQSVEAKEGKPYRIVVDCLAARHGLPRMEFSRLPKSVITALRTSQYAVKPEEVVRIVIDLAGEAVYRVETQGMTTKVYVSDPATQSITQWVSTGTEGATEQARPTAPVTTVVQNPVLSPTTQKKPSAVALQNNTSTTTANKATTLTTPVASAVTPTPTAAKTETIAQKPTQKAEVTTVAKAPQAVTTQPATTVSPTPTAAKTETIAQKPTQKTEVATVAKAPQTVITPLTTTVTPTPTATKTETIAQKPTQKAEVTTVAKAPQTATTPPVMTVTPTPTAAKTDKVSSKSPQQAELATTMKPQQTLPAHATQDLAAQTATRAQAFASIKDKQTTPPAPGDIPTAKAVDVHKETPAQAKDAAVVEKRENVSQEPTQSAASPDKASTKAALIAPPLVKESKDKVLADVPEESAGTSDPEEDFMADNQVSPADLLPAVNQTSRYRRDAAKGADLKQTLVMQFPQRMVTQYEEGDTRDPFESLIDITKLGKRNGDVRRIPNIDALILVGVLESMEGRGAALMEDLDGIGYILKPGDRVQNGYVAQIDGQTVSFEINEYGWSRTVVKEMEKEK